MSSSFDRVSSNMRRSAECSVNGGCQEDEAGHPPGSEIRDVFGEEAPGRVAREHDTPEAERVHERKNVGGEVARPVAFGRTAGVPVAAQAHRR
jgi:hypothetical protein